MRWFSTITFDPPAAIAYFDPAQLSAITNVRSIKSLARERILSAFEEAVRELQRYKEYGPRWDGYRAEPFADETLNSVARILDYTEMALLDAEAVPNLVTTGPASDGSIDIEIQMPDRGILMTLYPGEDELQLSSFHPEGADEHLVPLGTRDLEAWLSWLYYPAAVPNRVGQNSVHP